MEARLNRRNLGLTFNAEDCKIWIQVLQRTRAFSTKFVLRRQAAIDKISYNVNKKLSEITNMDSKTGIILEESRLAEEIAKRNEDDVARARQLLDEHGGMSQAPGITSCLYSNDSNYQGKLPTLKAVLKDCGKTPIHKMDNLLLTLDRELPNEFLDFPKIIALSFPDKFPLPVDDHMFMGSSMMNLKLRRHLLNFYDGRFCDMDFVFWIYNILRRHETIKRTATYFKFKKATKARVMFEKLCNEEDLTEKLANALKNEDSPEAKKLNKRFSDLITAVGGGCPWTSLERQRTLGKLYAMTNFLGLPTFFITIAPCIADSNICLELLNHTKCVYKLKESTHAERCRWTAKNPVASAKAFHIIINTLVSTFLNIATGNTKSTSPIDCMEELRKEDTIEDVFKRHLRNRMGCLGVPTGFFGIYEPQNRGALHLHAPLWTLLNAELITRCTVPELKKVCCLIDQLIASWIHNDDVEAEELDKTTKSLPRVGRREVQEGLSWNELESHAKRIMYRCQLHNRCSFTCFKGSYSKQTCRLALPSDYSELLRFLQLREVADADGKMLMPTKDPHIDPPPHDAPIPPKDPRVVICKPKKLSEIDTQLVNGNISISATVGCNTCIDFISTPGNAQGALFYISNYMKKAIDKSSAILPLVHSANKKRATYPSKAKDAGSQSRNAKYLTQIILNRLHGAEEVADQVAASFVYGYNSYISSHSFENFYPVDLYNYIKTGGESLFSEETAELDSKDWSVHHEDNDDEENLEIPGLASTSGLGQASRPYRSKLTEEEGGKIIIRVVKDIDDYIYRGPELQNFSPYMYKMAVTRVSKRVIEKRSEKEHSSGKTGHNWFKFDTEHPLAHSHVQRLRIKFPILQFVGMHMPKHPGEEPEDKQSPAFRTWKRKLVKLTNFIQAVYLPWNKDVEKFRDSDTVIEELRTYMTTSKQPNPHNLKEHLDSIYDNAAEKKQELENVRSSAATFINQHIRRTIGFALSASAVTYKEKKMIQLVRHEFSRKRFTLFSEDNEKIKPPHPNIIEEYAELLCEATDDSETENRSRTVMKKHLTTVVQDVEKLYSSSLSPTSPVRSVKPKTLKDAETILADVDEKIQNYQKLQEDADDEAEDEGGPNVGKITFPLEVQRDKFFKHMSKDQEAAGEFLLKKLQKQNENDQLLMLLHGSPGTGKSVFVTRVKNFTNILMRITATSGIAAMSLNGSTIDYLVDKRYGNQDDKNPYKLQNRLDNIKKRLGKATMLVIDEISMMGCIKFVELDSLLRKLKTNDKPFGGLDILLVGDFAQLPPVGDTSIISALVQSTYEYVTPDKNVVLASNLASLFLKFDLAIFQRSKGCNKLKELLQKYRSATNSKPITIDEIRSIGMLDRHTLKKDPAFQDATVLVSTRRERECLTESIGQLWAKKHGIPIYWWFKRPSKGDFSREEADAIAYNMTKRCSDIKSYYVHEAPCILKQNICPPIGYANGSQGKMVGIVPQEGYNLPTGAPGELIMIEPPQYIIMEVKHDDGEKTWTTTIACKRHAATLEYGKSKKKKKYHCMSTEVNLLFAMTIHETQGQTLLRVILLLGRQRGLHVGRVSWSLLYVALSRTKKLGHIRFFPSKGGWKDFEYLTKLKPNAIFRKWSESYRNHRWNPTHLRKKHKSLEKAVEEKLKLQGREITLRQTNDVIRGYLNQLGMRKVASAYRPELQLRILRYMERKKLWEPSDANPHPPSIRQKRKSSKRLSAGRKKKQVHNHKVIAKVHNKVLQPSAQKDSTSKNNKKKCVSQSEVCSKNNSKQKKKHQMSWLQDSNLVIFEIQDDGNCLFRAMSHQLYGTQNLHDIIRKKCCDYIELERNYFQLFIANVRGNLTVTRYVNKMRKDRTWGGNIELIAFAELYRKTIHIYQSGPQPNHVFGEGYSIAQGEDPIRLHYRDGNHYESLLSYDACQYFQVDQAGIIEEDYLNQFRKLKLVDSSSNYGIINEEKDALNIEEMNIQAAIQESIELHKIEKERADIRKKFEEDLKEALQRSMEQANR